MKRPILPRELDCEIYKFLNSEQYFNNKKFGLVTIHLSIEIFKYIRNKQQALVEIMTKFNRNNVNIVDAFHNYRDRANPVKVIRLQNELNRLTQGIAPQEDQMDFILEEINSIFFPFHFNGSRQETFKRCYDQYKKCGGLPDFTVLPLQLEQEFVAQYNQTYQEQAPIRLRAKRGIFRNMIDGVLLEGVIERIVWQ